VYTALPNVFPAFGQAFFDSGFGGENQAIALQLNLQGIAGGKA
jgi:hypothetical protein